MKSFCIIGLGQFGMTLATTLAESGHQVMVIDSDSDKVNELSDLVTNAIIGDATNEKVLRASGAADYDCAVVCMTENMNDNILITIMLKELGAGRIIARAANEGHKRVLEHIGADLVVFPEQDMAEKLAYMLPKKHIGDYVEFSGYKMVEVSVPAEWCGKSIMQIDVRRKYGISIIAISTEDGEAVEVSPRPDRVFMGKDRISVIGPDRDIDRFTEKF